MWISRSCTIKTIKQRLDQLLIELGYFDSRQKAQAAIMTNCVKIAGQVLNKSGTQINVDKFNEELENNPKYLEIEDKSCPYVSRGAYKLEAAYKEFNLDFTNAIVMDIGSSTGGFTDFVLQHGAEKVIAIDVGKAQLHYRLRENPRILNLEEENFRYLDFTKIAPALNDQKIDFAVADLSFISLTKILDKLNEIIDKSGSQNIKCIFLIKPQFEAGKDIANKFKGIIKDNAIRQNIVNETVKNIESQGFSLEGLKESPIKGAKGNIEFISCFTVARA